MGICLYKREQVRNSGENTLFDVIDCICYGIRHKLNGHCHRNLTDNPWIDGSVEKYSEHFVRDVSAFLRVNFR